MKHVLPEDPLGSCAHQRRRGKNAYYPGLRLVCFQKYIRGETSVIHIRLKATWAALKKREILTHGTPWMNLDNIILSEASQTLKDKYCMILVTRGA